jgi:cell wall-associated NlpC family hydrolase
MSAVAMAAIAALFAPLPASAAPGAPQAPAVPLQPAVPDSGSRPIALGTLVMPGQVATAAPAATPGVATSPVQAQRDKMQADIAALGDQLIQLGQDQTLATQAQTTAVQKVAEAQTLLAQAQTEAAAAAAASLRDAAAMPPGTFGSDLQGLGALAQLQQGDTASEQSAARHVALAQSAMTAARSDQTSADQRMLDLNSQYAKTQAGIATKQKALTKYETAHAKELSLADATENAQDALLSKLYLQGTGQGRGADPRAIAALKVALKQIGDPYVWSEEGPNQFDCSGLMFYSYHQATNYPLARVSRDQYWQTHANVVDRYSLLPGDLLFFSYSNSWTDIHHVAMYAGNGMMIEAPRTGLDVRLTPVRWTRLFQATRVFGSVDGPVQGPDLSHLPTSGNDSGTGNGTPSPSPSATTKPPTTKPTKPSTGPTTPSTGPSTPSTGPSTPSTPPSTEPTTPATQAPPATDTPSTTQPATGDSSPTGSGSSSTTPSGSGSGSTTPSGSGSSATTATASSSSSGSSASASSSSSGEPK